MRRVRVAAAAAGLVAALAACSGERSDESGPSPAAAPTPSPQVETNPVTPPTAGTGAQNGALGGGARLTGQVSGLTGRISGFAMRQTESQTIVELASDVLFAFDSARLTAEAEAALRRTAELAAQAGSGRITVVGHTDSVGEDAYNLALSRRRAEAVAQWLAASGGVPADRLHAEGRGEAEPAAPNATTDGQDDPEGRARNRRVVVAIPRA